MRRKEVDKKKHLVLFSGAGMSAESGLKTFRDHGGLWENYDINQVATPEAWNENRELVLKFYNQRRTQLLKAKPNLAHKMVAELEKDFKVTVITQNIDDLHERAGSSKVIHLHGELLKARSEQFSDLIYDWKKERIEIGDCCERGTQLRPHVVWFGEEVPQMEVALQQMKTADLLVVIGTSLTVYPAASLIQFVLPKTQCFLIDPKPSSNIQNSHWTVIQENSIQGMKVLIKELRSHLS